MKVKSTPQFGLGGEFDKINNKSGKCFEQLGYQSCQLNIKDFAIFVQWPLTDLYFALLVLSSDALIVQKIKVFALQN